MTLKLTSDKLNNIVTEIVTALETNRNKVDNFEKAAIAKMRALQNMLQRLKEEIKENLKYQDMLLAQFDKSRKELIEITQLLKNNKESNQYIQANYERIYKEAKMLWERIVEREEHQLKLFSMRKELEVELRETSQFIKETNSLKKSIDTSIDQITGKISEINCEIKSKEEFVLNLVKVQEEERKRIARDIHDGPAQSLAGFLMSLETIDKTIDKNLFEAKNKIEDLKASIRETLVELREIIYDIRPNAIDDQGLFPILKNHINKLQSNYSLVIKMKPLDEHEIALVPKSINLMVFRIIQEILNNVIKHAKANQVNITFELVDNLLKITATDDIGFDTERLKSIDKEKHFGILGIKERVELLNGSFNIASTLKKGTNITISIPISTA